jgi:hypothetical protein
MSRDRKSESNLSLSRRLFEAFNSTVFLTERAIPSDKVLESPRLMRQALFEGMYEDAPRVLEEFEFDLEVVKKEFGRIKNPISRLVLLADLAAFSFPPGPNLKVLDSPKINVETKTIACTMATLLGFYILDNLDFENNFYISPPSHSVNGVRVGVREYYVDIRNGAVREIRRTGKVKGTNWGRAEVVEILDPFESGYFARLAVACMGDNLSSSVGDNFLALLRAYRRKELRPEEGDDQKNKFLKGYFSQMASEFSNWSPENFAKYNSFLSPGLIALVSGAKMEEERKRMEKLHRRSSSDDRDKRLVRQSAGDLAVQGIEPTVDKVVDRLQSRLGAEKRKRSVESDPLLKDLRRKGLESYLA